MLWCPVPVVSCSGPLTLVEMAIEKGAQAVLMPVTSRRQLFDLSDDMATKVEAARQLFNNARIPDFRTLENAVDLVQGCDLVLDATDDAGVGAPLDLADGAVRHAPDPTGEVVRTIINDLAAQRFGTATARYRAEEELILSPAAAPAWRRGLEQWRRGLE